MFAILTPNDSLTAVMSGAAATTNPTYSAVWREDGGAENQPTGSLSGATAVTLVSAPSAGQRQVERIGIYNGDTAAVTVTIAKVVSGTSYTLNAITLPVGGMLLGNADGTVTVCDSSGQALTSVSTAFTTRVTTTDAVASGTARVVGGLAYSNTAASAAHTNTTTEALFDKQYSIPANTLKAGTVVKVRYQGIATATNANDTLTIKLYIGGLTGTALLTGTATDVANSNIFAGECTIVVRTAGATGTFVAVGTHTEVPAASGTAVHDVTEITASTTIDTTAAQVLGVGADWSAADSGNSCRLDIFTVEIL